MQGALSFWDYAAAAPHLAIDMNPAGGPEMAKVGGCVCNRRTFGALPRSQCMTFRAL
jgi:hypothetical protein